ncbi:hypothetical protein HY523_02080 [Candidatus Berkelbacteria bacterium]|nr:hypothetical protein [Candidatus Berkelbacteria bacterium]
MNQREHPDVWLRYSLANECLEIAVLAPAGSPQRTIELTMFQAGQVDRGGWRIRLQMETVMLAPNGAFIAQGTWVGTRGTCPGGAMTISYDPTTTSRWDALRFVAGRVPWGQVFSTP